jgi:hypothetical protein
MRSHTTIITLLSLSIFGACTSDADPPTSQVTGAMRYDDATTNADGTPREAAAPPADQDVTITVEVRGTGVLEGLDTTCQLDGATGQFHALFDGTAAVDENGAYVAALADGSAQIETLTGCAIPTLTVSVISDVVVRGEIAATTTSCQSYCAASARGAAEAECAGSSTEAECRATAEASATASCQTECTTQRDVIVAEVSLAGSLLGDLDADALRAAAFGQLSADLTFDHME